MAYPPTVPPSSRINTTPQADNHPSDHNQISSALTAIINELGSNPSGSQGTLQTRVTNLETNKVSKSGGTMTGQLIVEPSIETSNIYLDYSTTGGVPNGANAGISLSYANAHYLQDTGGTVNGSIIVGGPPNTGPGVAIGDTGSYASNINDTAASPNINLRKGPNANAVGQRFIKFESGSAPGTDVGEIELASSSSVAYNTASDHRLKSQEGPVQDPAGRIKQLGALAFQGRWIADEGVGQQWDMLYAHDIGAVAPYAVSGAKDAVDGEGNPSYQSVDYGSLVPLLIAALADALARIEALEAAP